MIRGHFLTVPRARGRRRETAPFVSTVHAPPVKRTPAETQAQVVQKVRDARFARKELLHAERLRQQARHERERTFEREREDAYEREMRAEREQAEGWRLFCEVCGD